MDVLPGWFDGDCAGDCLLGRIYSNGLDYSLHKVWCDPTITKLIVSIYDIGLM